MEIVKLGILILITVIIVNGLPVMSKEILVFITFSCCIVVLLYTIKIVTPAVEYIKNIAARLSFDGIEVIIKAVGIGFITQFVSDTALDCSNRTLANQMVFAGRIAILVLAMPLFAEVFKIIERLTNI